MGKITRFLAKNWYILAILTFLVGISYYNSLGNTFVSDDLGLLTDKFDGLNYVFKFPFSAFNHLLFYVIHAVSGLNPAAFHFVNIVFHLGNVVLVYLILSKLFNKTLAFFAATLFSVHPILTESVTWISGGVYVKYAFFFLFSFLAYLYSSKNIKLYLLAIFCFFLALQTSDKAFVLSLAFCFYELTLGNIRQNWKKLIPFLIFSFIWGLSLFTNVGTRETAVSVQSYDTSGFFNPFIQLPSAIGTYLKLIFWPQNLSFYHSGFFTNQWEFIFLALITLFYFSVLVLCFWRQKFLAFWLGFFLLTLLPVLTPLKIAWVVAERYVYLGTLGIIVVFCYFFAKLTLDKRFKTAIWMIFLVLVVVLSFRTAVRNQDFQSADTLWIATVKTDPYGQLSHNNMGDYWTRHNDLEKAANEFKIALSLNPSYADAYHNLANTYQKMGQFSLALTNYQMAVAINPSLWQSYENMGIIYLNTNNKTLAKETFLKALQINPQSKVSKLGLSEAEK